MKALLATVIVSVARALHQVEDCGKTDVIDTQFGTAQELPSTDGGSAGLVLSLHWLMVPAGCSATITADARERLLPRQVGVATDALGYALGLPRGECSAAACLGKGLPINTLPNGARRKPWHENLELEQWVETNCQVISVGFVSLLGPHPTWNAEHGRVKGWDVPVERVRIQWMDSTKAPHFGRAPVLPNGRSGGWRTDGRLEIDNHANTSTCHYRFELWTNARLGERFVIHTERGELIMNRTVDHDGINVIGEPPPHPDLLTRFGHDGDMPTWREWDPMIQAVYQENLDRKRLVQHSFTAAGYRVGKVPPNVMASMLAYHHNNYDNLVPEEYNPWTPDGGMSSNFWLAPSYIIPISPALKADWATGLQAQMHTWLSGKVPTQFNALYGMRVYTDNSKLFSHVDKIQTHAISTVVNIAQSGVREPWPIEMDCRPDIHRTYSDHLSLVESGEVQGVLLKPSEMLLYESARCLHGRSRPFQGTRFTNLFAHYSPLHEPYWYKSNKTERKKGSLPGTSTTDEASQQIRPRAASCTMMNEAPRPIEVWWLPPPTFDGGTDPLLVTTIEGNTNMILSGSLGDKYLIKGACEDEILVENDGDTFNLCLSLVPLPEYKRRLDSMVERYQDAAFGLFRNLCGRSLALWSSPTKDLDWSKSNSQILQGLRWGGTGAKYYTPQPGMHVYLNAPSGSIYCITEANEERGCQESIGALRLVANGSGNDYYFAFDDGSGDPVWHQAWAEEKAKGIAYKERTGRDWVIPRGVHTTEPIDESRLPIRTPKAVGEEIVVRTNHTRLDFIDNPSALTIPANQPNYETIRMRALAVKPAAWLIDNFLSEAEASKLVEMGRQQIKRSTIAEGLMVAERTSKNGWIERGAQGSMTDRISRRAADILGIDERILQDNGSNPTTEKYQLVNYQAGQWYASHTDWSVDPVASGGHLRFCTLLMYLNTPKGQDGGTAFPLAEGYGGYGEVGKEKMVVQPKKGSALLFYNLLPDGNADVNSMHIGLPVQAGEKWVSNLWVRLHGKDFSEPFAPSAKGIGAKSSFGGGAVSAALKKLMRFSGAATRSSTTPTAAAQEHMEL